MSALSDVLTRVVHALLGCPAAHALSSHFSARCEEAEQARRELHMCTWSVCLRRQATLVGQRGRVILAASRPRSGATSCATAWRTWRVNGAYISTHLLTGTLLRPRSAADLATADGPHRRSIADDLHLRAVRQADQGAEKSHRGQLRRQGASACIQARAVPRLCVARESSGRRDLLPDGVQTGFLHNEKQPRNCYRQVEAVWAAIRLEQARPPSS